MENRDTPRVDALQTRWRDKTDVMELVECYALARQIERELALAVDALKMARPYIDHSYIREKLDAALAEIGGQP